MQKCKKIFIMMRYDTPSKCDKMWPGGGGGGGGLENCTYVGGGVIVLKFQHKL